MSGQATGNLHFGLHPRERPTFRKRQQGLLQATASGQRLSPREGLSRIVGTVDVWRHQGPGLPQAEHAALLCLGSALLSSSSRPSSAQPGSIRAVGGWWSQPIVAGEGGVEGRWTSREKQDRIQDSLLLLSCHMCHRMLSSGSFLWAPGECRRAPKLACPWLLCEVILHLALLTCLPWCHLPKGLGISSDCWCWGS